METTVATYQSFLRIATIASVVEKGTYRNITIGRTKRQVSRSGEHGLKSAALQKNPATAGSEILALRDANNP
jgi:hypothetical protein